ncbi:hypothetical protein P5E67_00690 [Vibrio parahaemolyticus]|nr:hypothetical protein [Vibrio parahaemolyticus]
MARPSWVPPDLNEVEKLAACGLSQRQLASALGVSYETLRKRKRDMKEFEDAIERGRAKSIHRVANKLYEAAMAGNVTSIIYFLKTRSPSQWNEFVIADELKAKRELEAKKALIREEARALKDAGGNTGVLAIPMISSSEASLKEVADKMALRQQELKRLAMERAANVD